MKRILLLLVTTIFCFACNPFEEEVERTVVATVFEKHLYADDIEELVSYETSPEDSAHIVSQYLDQWIKTQLLVKKAEINLTDHQKNVEKELEDYRSSLLIDRYLQSFTSQKLDTNINVEDIQAFYTTHMADFKLATNVVRAAFVTLNLDAPNLDDVEDWMKSDEEQDLIRLEDYCYSNAVKFKTYNNDWVSFSKLQQDFPKRIENPTDFLRRNRKIEYRDSLYHYMVVVKEHRIEGEETPLNFVSDNIKKILITKRKSNLIKELKNNIYKDALDNEYFSIEKNTN